MVFRNPKPNRKYARLLTKAYKPLFDSVFFKVIHNKREQFFVTIKRRYPNLHMVYCMSCIICIWSGTWYLVDTWAQGADLMTAAREISLEVLLRHGLVLLLGISMLYLDDKSLQELLFMKKTMPAQELQSLSRRERVFCYLKTHYPNAMTIYTIFGIIFSWCGTWGLLWDIPLAPFWRSLMTIFLGFFLLYLDDLKLDELC